MKTPSTTRTEDEQLKRLPTRYPLDTPLDSLAPSEGERAGVRGPLPESATEPSLLCYLVRSVTALALLALVTWPARGQVLLNVDFGVGRQSAKTGFAATGQATNDFWNLYHHYAPKFIPGMALVANGEMAGLKLADGRRQQS